jgi:hypothetical protein
VQMIILIKQLVVTILGSISEESKENIPIPIQLCAASQETAPLWLSTDHTRKTRAQGPRSLSHGVDFVGVGSEEGGLFWLSWVGFCIFRPCREFFCIADDDRG